MFYHLSDIVRDDWLFSLYMKIFERLNLSRRALPRKNLEICSESQLSRTNVVIQDVFSICFQCSALTRQYPRFLILGRLNLVHRRKILNFFEELAF